MTVGVTAVRPAPQRTIFNGVAAVFGASSLAVAQPLLQSFGSNPEYFVVGRLGRWQIVAFALAIAIAPPALLAVISLGAHKVRPLLGRVAVGGSVAVLTALFVAPLTRASVLGAAWPVKALLLAVAGLGAGYLVDRLVPVRLVLAYASIANLAFLGLFLGASQTGDLVKPGGAVTGVSITTPHETPPIVFLILDEAALTTLITPDGEINDQRFPGFAELAARSTWWRNASSVSQYTQVAVPSLLVGNIVEWDTPPTLAEHPVNVFTLLDDHYLVDAYEPVSQLCPTETCGEDPVEGRALLTALDDAAIVYGHRTLPVGLRSQLPSIESSWGDYRRGSEGSRTEVDVEPAAPASTTDATTPAPETPPPNRPPKGRLAERQHAVLLDRIPSFGEPTTLSFTHVIYPHSPWYLTPFGYQSEYAPEYYRSIFENMAVSETERAFLARQTFQMYLLQMGALDQAIGTMIDELDRSGRWDETLIVVTSDHGTSNLLPRPGRLFAAESSEVEEILRVPLFVKAPGQQVGEVRDENARTIDIVPTILDAIGAETAFAFDGHSLLDESPFPDVTTVEPLDETGVDRMSSDLQPLLDLAARHAQNFPRGDGWDAVFAVGDHARWIDLPERDLPLEASGQGYSTSLDQRAFLADIDLDYGVVPMRVSGTMTVPPGSEPAELVVSLNGTLAGVGGGFDRQDDGTYTWSALLGPHFVDGRNDVRVYHPVGDGFIEVTVTD